MDFLVGAGELGIRVCFLAGGVGEVGEVTTPTFGVGVAGEFGRVCDDFVVDGEEVADDLLESGLGTLLGVAGGFFIVPGEEGLARLAGGSGAFVPGLAVVVGGEGGTGFALGFGMAGFICYLLKGNILGTR